PYTTLFRSWIITITCCPADVEGALVRLIELRTRFPALDEVRVSNEHAADNRGISSEFIDPVLGIVELANDSETRIEQQRPAVLLLDQSAHFGGHLTFWFIDQHGDISQLQIRNMREQCLVGSNGFLRVRFINTLHMELRG